MGGVQYQHNIIMLFGLPLPANTVLCMDHSSSANLLLQYNNIIMVTGIPVHMHKIIIRLFHHIICCSYPSVARVHQ